jgi:hypothetical protein
LLGFRRDTPKTTGVGYFRLAPASGLFKATEGSASASGLFQASPG